MTTSVAGTVTPLARALRARSQDPMSCQTSASTEAVRSGRLYAVELFFKLQFHYR